MDRRSGTGGTVRFSIVTAVHDVSRYLPDFIASIEGQDVDPSWLQVVAVDDGSTDDSLEVLRAWEARRPGLVTVLTKPNGGQGSARNLGLGHARGEWVTFSDPDDVLAPDYFSRVAGAVEAEPGLAMVATNRVILVDETQELVERHPLRAMFAHRDQVRDLDRFPDYFHGAANAAFFRRAVIEDLGLCFDERIRPNFEDGHFCQRYLLHCPSAASPSSRAPATTTASGSTRPRRCRPGPLGRSASPRFRATAISSCSARRPSSSVTGARVAAEHDHLRALVLHQPRGRRLEQRHRLPRRRRRGVRRAAARDPRASSTRTSSAASASATCGPSGASCCCTGSVDEPWHTPYVVLHRYDERRQQVLVSYRFAGEEPDAQVTVRGLPATPVATKSRDFVYFDHPCCTSGCGGCRPAASCGRHRRAPRRDPQRVGGAPSPGRPPARPPARSAPRRSHARCVPTVPSADELLLRLAGSRRPAPLRSRLGADGPRRRRRRQRRAAVPPPARRPPGRERLVRRRRAHPTTPGCGRRPRARRSLRLDRLEAVDAQLPST